MSRFTSLVIRLDWDTLQYRALWCFPGTTVIEVRNFSKLSFKNLKCYFSKGDGDLPDDDRLAIQSIYGSRDGSKQWGPNTRERRPYVTRPTTTTTVTTRRTTTTRRPYARPYNPRRTDSNYPPKNPDKPRYYPSVKTTQATTTTPHHQNHHHHHNKHHEKPETCNTSYDAITIIRGETFIFKNRYLWRIGKEGLHNGYPHEITKIWGELPHNLHHIDTVYENKRRQIVFFIG